MTANLLKTRTTSGLGTSTVAPSVVRSRKGTKGRVCTKVRMSSNVNMEPASTCNLTQVYLLRTRTLNPSAWLTAIVDDACRSAQQIWLRCSAAVANTLMSVPSTAATQGRASWRARRAVATASG